ncbi:hypothetical protein Dsin_015944 [Dipteronia sinensis]|uniref:Transmembrane protein n=1 Tax=Dipteronia sinensis TaxID=43782 RepID=A0AAE0E6G7_9ROSI|nr:hypothetical protein Dsin_015944 [Dipteronia sinensis]
MMTKWASSNNQKLNSKGVKNENDLLMGHLLNSQKSGMELMQNCDLPPPLKVFTGSDKRVISSMNRGFGPVRAEEDHDNWEFDGENDGKLELLKALRFSQTRAREAEKRAANLTKERDCLSKAFFDDSLRLLAYRQCVKLLEVQVSMLQWQRQELEGEHMCCDCDDDIDNGVELSWFVALALCLGIAGVGFAFGCRYLL